MCKEEGKSEIQDAPAAWRREAAGSNQHSLLPLKTRNSSLYVVSCMSRALDTQSHPYSIRCLKHHSNDYDDDQTR